MRVRDLTPGMKVWYGSQDELRRGDGELVKVKATGKYAVVREPCGPVIVAIPATVPGPTSIIIEFAQDDRALARWGSSTARPRFKKLYDGRNLMHEDEHRVMRQAAADRQLEIDAHRQRGEALQETAIALARKALHEAGMPVDLLELRLSKRYSSGNGPRHIVDAHFNEDELRRLLASSELKTALREYTAWSKLPTPGRDCIR